MSKLGDWWGKYFLTLELLAAIALALSVLIWGEFSSGKLALDQMMAGNQTNIYENLAAVFGTLLGFVITATSIVLGYVDNENLEFIRKSAHYGDLWKVYKSAMRSLAFATAAGLSGILFDNIAEIKYYLIYLNVFTVSLATFRLGRSIWILENIITLVTKPPATPAKAPSAARTTPRNRSGRNFRRRN